MSGARTGILIVYNARHNVSVWLRTGYNPPDINRFRSDTRNIFLETNNLVLMIINLILIKIKHLGSRQYSTKIWNSETNFKGKIH